MTRKQKIIIAISVAGAAFIMYKVMQKKTITRPTLTSLRGKTNFSDEAGTRYNEYGTSFVRPNKINFNY